MNNDLIVVIYIVCLVSLLLLVIGLIDDVRDMISWKDYSFKMIGNVIGRSVGILVFGSGLVQYFNQFFSIVI